MPVLAGGAFGLVIGQQLVPSGYGVPTHIYDADDELCVILGGEITVAGLSGDRPARAGSSVMLPRAIAYKFRSDGPQPAPMLALLLPRGQALEMFRYLDRAGRQASRLAPAEIAVLAPGSTACASPEHPLSRSNRPDDNQSPGAR